MMSWFAQRKGQGIGILLVVGLLAFLASPAAALVYSIDKDPNHLLYGDLPQNRIPPPALGAVACGPTAAVNSFVYLQRKYGGVYDTLLVPDQAADLDLNGVSDFYDDEIAVAQTLADPLHMNTKAPGGTWDDMFIFGKMKYIEEVAPNRTIYAAQMSGTWAHIGRPADEIPPIGKPIWVQDNTVPKWEFLWTNLVSCEDVEVLLNYGDWGHFLTLKSFEWNDIDNDLVMDFEEGGQIDYIDPCTGGVGWSHIWQTARNAQLFVDYNDYDYAELVMAVKESVPEPSTIVLLLFGAACLLGRRRR
jgi:hypothetical protein